jgi:hypothetical protein
MRLPCPGRSAHIERKLLLRLTPIPKKMQPSIATLKTIWKEGKLRFDYKLYPGIVQTSNALSLMRSIGLEV